MGVYGRLQAEAGAEPAFSFQITEKLVHHQAVREERLKQNRKIGAQKIHPRPPKNSKDLQNTRIHQITPNLQKARLPAQYPTLPRTIERD